MTKRRARPGHVGSGREPEPPEHMALRFAALGPRGPVALAELWKRPRLHAVAEPILNMIDRARPQLAEVRKGGKGWKQYVADRSARDRERKVRLPAEGVLDMTAPPPGWSFHPRFRGVLVRARREGERPHSFSLLRGRRLDTDVLADLRAHLVSLGVPTRGRVNLVARLVALARSPRRA